MKGPSLDILTLIDEQTTPAQFAILLAERGEDINGFVPGHLYGWSILHHLLCPLDHCGERIVMMMLKKLILYGADVNSLCVDGGWSPLTLAVLRRNYDYIEILMDAGAIIDCSLENVPYDIDDRGRITSNVYRNHVYAYAARIAQRIRACRAALCAVYSSAGGRGIHKDLARAVMRVVWEHERRNRAWESVVPRAPKGRAGNKEGN